MTTFSVDAARLGAACVVMQGGIYRVVCKMHGWTNGCMRRRMHGWMDGWTHGRMDGRMDGWMDGRMDGRKHGWMR